MTYSPLHALVNRPLALPCMSTHNHSDLSFRLITTERFQPLTARKIMTRTVSRFGAAAHTSTTLCTHANFCAQLDAPIFYGPKTFLPSVLHLGPIHISAAAPCTIISKVTLRPTHARSHHSHARSHHVLCACLLYNVYATTLTMPPGRFNQVQCSSPSTHSLIEWLVTDVDEMLP